MALRRGTGLTACAPRRRRPKRVREAAGRRRESGQGARASAAREAQGAHGGQGSALAGSRGRSRCRMPAFAGLSRKAGRRREGIPGSIELGVPDARAWAVNNKTKVAIRQGYGFRNIDNLIALVMLRCSDLRPTLPGRAVVT